MSHPINNTCNEAIIDYLYEYFGTQIKNKNDISDFISSLSKNELQIHIKRMNQGLNFYL